MNRVDIFSRLWPKGKELGHVHRLGWLDMSFGSSSKHVHLGGHLKADEGQTAVTPSHGWSEKIWRILPEEMVEVTM